MTSTDPDPDYRDLCYRLAAAERAVMATDLKRAAVYQRLHELDQNRNVDDANYRQVCEQLAAAERAVYTADLERARLHDELAGLVTFPTSRTIRP